MKVKAIKRFYDRKEKELRLPNDEFTVNKERGEELLSSPSRLVEEVKEAKTPKKKKGD